MAKLWAQAVERHVKLGHIGGAGHESRDYEGLDFPVYIDSIWSL